MLGRFPFSQAGERDAGAVCPGCVAVHGCCKSYMSRALSGQANNAPARSFEAEAARYSKADANENGLAETSIRSIASQHGIAQQVGAVLYRQARSREVRWLAVRHGWHHRRFHSCYHQALA